MRRLASTADSLATRSHAIARKFRQDREGPTSPDFSGWNCAPQDGPRSTTDGERSPCSVVGHGVAGDRRGERVGEVDCEPIAQAVDSATRGVAVERVPADVRHLRRRRGRRSAEPEAAARATRPRPGRSGASSLPSNSHCSPGRCRAAARRSSTRAPDRRRATARRAAPSPPKWPTPGTTMPSRVRTIAPGRRRHERLRADGREGLADRRQVAGAVVDQGDRHDHSRPFVLTAACAPAGDPARTPPAARARTP